MSKVSSHITVYHVSDLANEGWFLVVRHCQALSVTIERD